MKLKHGWLSLVLVSLVVGRAEAQGQGERLFLPGLAAEYLPAYAAVAARGEAEVGSPCDWEPGVLAIGWAHAWRAAADERALAWTSAWADRCIAAAGPITHVNDALLGYAAIIAHQADPKPSRLAYAQAVADWLLTSAPRSRDGALTHVGDTVWDDTLISTVPFLTEMSRASGDDRYRELAFLQMRLHQQLLQDPATGLYRHAWQDSLNGHIGPHFWGRGNGWVLYATAEGLESMPVTHTLRAATIADFVRQAQALAALQTADGRWHTVVDHPETFVETSAAALIGAGLNDGLSGGWLPATLRPATCAAARGTWAQVDADGKVLEVSAGTPPLANPPLYQAIPNTELQLFGQGVALLIARPYTHCPVSGVREQVSADT